MIFFNSSVKKKIWLIIFVFLLFSWNKFVFSDKTDVIIMKNGDRLTGEIKEMDRGILKCSTDHMKMVFIKWPEVTNISSEDRFEIQLESGERFVGYMKESNQKGKVVFLIEEQSQSLDLASIIKITPLENVLLKRLRVSLDIGFSYNKANKAVQWNFGSEIEFRTLKQEYKVTGSSYFSDQEYADISTRNSLQFLVRRFLPHKNSINWLASLQQNEELGLLVRVLLGGSFGRSIIQTNQSRLLVLCGLVKTWEQYDASEGGSNHTEIFLGLNYETFKHVGNTLNLNANIGVFPSLTSKNRYRIELNMGLLIEIFENFFWGLKFHDSFDSNPPATSDSIEKNDFGVSVSLGWSK